MAPGHQDTSDEELMSQLAHGHQEALGPLYSRYAPRIFRLASQTLDRASAEEIVQDVFLTIWRKADAFQPQRGAFRAWVFQIAHFRVLNELRRQSRRPQVEADPDGPHLAGLPDPDPGPEEVVDRAEDRAALRAALEGLPETQRRALDLAFFDERSHQEVAAELGLPLGTAKTRIRGGLQRLRLALVPTVAALVVCVASLGTFFGIRYRSEQAARQLDEQALALLTSSETTTLRLAPAPGMPAQAHGDYRGRAGTTLAVVNLSYVLALPADRTYQVWVRHNGVWTSLGTARPDVQGYARFIVIGRALAALPEAVEVTVEPATGSSVPLGPIVLRWPPK